MTQQVFAQFIEMSPASLSSIFNGRTKPTLNVVEAIKKKLPDISIDWLMFGSGSMYNDSYASVAPVSSSPTPSAPSSKGVESMLDFSDSPQPSPDLLPGMSENRGYSPKVFNSVENTRSNSHYDAIKIIDKQPRRVTEIRVFYDDQTWDSFVPAKK